MPVLISCTLTEPPSSTTCFRDITLFTSCFLKQNVLLECEKELQDTYWKWLKRKHSWDFVKDIVPIGSEHGISIRESIGTITVPRIDYDNLSFIISRLQNIAGK